MVVVPPTGSGTSHFLLALMDVILPWPTFSFSVSSSVQHTVFMQKSISWTNFAFSRISQFWVLAIIHSFAHWKFPLLRWSLLSVDTGHWRPILGDAGEPAHRNRVLHCPKHPYRKGKPCSTSTSTMPSCLRSSPLCHPIRGSCDKQDDPELS
jgi:hypothetical protein